MQFWDKRFWSPVAQSNIFCSNNFFYGTCIKGDRGAVAGLLNSTFHFLQIEIMGRTNQGQGVLNTYGPDYTYILVIDPSLIDSQKMKTAFETIALRPVTSIFDEIHKQDRIDLDNIIFDVLGLTKKERNEVYNSLAELVKSRLERAKSLDV